MDAQTMPRADEDAPLQGGPITTLRTQLEQRAAEFQMVLPAHISADKFQRTILTAVQANPELLKCDRRSLLTACMKAAQDGLLPDGREAVIAPFNTRMKVAGKWEWVKLAQYMPMVFGLRKKILQSNEITDLFASVVYRQEVEAKLFVYEEGTERTLRHKPILTADFKPCDEDVVLAYSVATFTNGLKSFQVMRRFELDEVREMSQTGAQFDADGNPRDSKGPWREWYGEMCKKSVIRRHSKVLPQSGDILADVEGEDLAFAARTVALLDSQEPDENVPAPPESRIKSDNQIQSDAATDNKQPEPEPEPKPKRVRKPRAAKADPEPQRELEPEPDPKPDDTTKPEDPEEAGEPMEREPELDGEQQGEPGTDEYGVTASQWDAIADELIERARRVEFLMDLRKLEREAELSLAEMPVEIASVVDTEFAAARKRIAQPKEKPGLQ